MRKPIQYLAVLSTAAVMSAAAAVSASPVPGLAMNAFAATSAGWVQEDGELRYYDSDGYYLTDTWKKRDNEWYYLDEDGFISRSMMVDEYYVDEDGKRVIYEWVTVDNEDEWDDDAPDTYYYYYGKDGKMVVSKWQVVDDKSYYFDSDGVMQTGKLELDGYTYYLGDENDGTMKKGWVQLENEDEDADEDMVWHYFDSKGRMVVNEIDRKIDGSYYTFEDGVMQTGWYLLPSVSNADANVNADADTNASADANVNTDANTGNITSATPTINDYQYYAEDGKRASGWYNIEGAPDLSDEDEVYRFYFKEGKPYHAEKGVQVFSIDSKRYGFNEVGEMQTDLQVVTLEDGSTANYYFGEDGAMLTGKQVIYDEDLGENQTWYFITSGDSKGQGYHGVRDNHVYNNGLQLEADSDLRYAPVELDGVRYLVNASGTIQKASSSTKSSARPELGSGYKDYKDSNDTVWTVNTDGIVVQ